MWAPVVSLSFLLTPVTISSVLVEINEKSGQYHLVLGITGKMSHFLLLNRIFIVNLSYMSFFLFIEKHIFYPEVAEIMADFIHFFILLRRHLFLVSYSEMRYINNSYLSCCCTKHLSKINLRKNLP